MLHRSVPERALGALLGGEPAATVLHRHLAALSSDKSSLQMGALREDLRIAIQRDIDCRTGGSLRLNETDTAVDSLCGEALLCTPEMAPLDAAFDAVLEFSGSGTVQLKNIHVQRYAELLAELDATVLVAWKLVEQAERSGHGKQANLKDAVDRLSTLFVGPQFDATPFAENHAHLAGVTGNELVLAQIVLGQTLMQAHAEHKDVLQRVRRIRRILESLVYLWRVTESTQQKEIKKQINAWATTVLPAISDKDKEATPDAQLDWDTLAKGIPTNWKSDALVCSSWLVWEVADAASKNQFEIAWIWLFIALWRTYRTKGINTTARAILLLVIADIMVLRRRLLMDGSGLRRFTTQCVASPLRDVAKQRAHWEISSSQDVARRLFARRGDKAAIKVGLDTLRDAWLPSLASDANAIIRVHEGDQKLSHERSREHWHLCVHFNRVREEQTRRRLWELAMALRENLYSNQAWALTKWSIDEIGQPEYKVFPPQLIRGLDVVGDETRWPIERFAPMIRWLRSTEAAPEAPLKLPDELVQRPEPCLHLSIHAGEDYAHPLSGLRHVDETVEFCEMRNGDRLGHALALGIPPDEWLQRHGDVTLPLDDHVDNLVWAWHQATTQLGDLSEAKCVLPRLKKRIERLLPHVSWYPSNAALPPLTEQHLEHLHQAWVLRKNCPYKALQQAGGIVVDGIGGPNCSEIRTARGCATPDTPAGLYVLRADRESDSLLGERKTVWQVCITALRHGHITRRQRELEERDADAIAAERRKPTPYLFDHDDDADLRFMLAVQDACLERYANRGLSIETNPSSNVYIGQLQTHSDHPIYRWDPPNARDLDQNARFNQFGLRSQPMPVTINTDDPGMIPTTLRMEHHLMHEAAIDRGYTEQEAHEWIENLRQRGLTQFEAAHK